MNLELRLSEQFPQCQPELRPAGEKETALLEEYAEVLEQERRIADRRVALEQELKKTAGGADGLAWPRGFFVYQHGREVPKVDWVALATSLLRTLSEEERVLYVSEFSEMKPARRIHFHVEVS